MGLRSVRNRHFGQTGYTRRAPLSAFIIAMALMIGGRANAQSTFGSFLGTVEDASGRAVAEATATLTNTGTAASKTVKTDKDGVYSFLDVETWCCNRAIRNASMSN
jgi:hypothetical protein